jgi:hypothetical protein
LREAKNLAAKGKVLLSFDVPIGIPESFFSAIRMIPGWETAARFDNFLPLAAHDRSFYEVGDVDSDWCVKKPFFKVPSGDGAKSAFDDVAQRAGVGLRRRIEERTGGDPVFITAGIPGSVGSAAIDVWKGLARLLPEKRDFKLWPVEGTLPDLFASASIVVAENYPRTIYAAARSDLPAAERPRMRIAKTRRELREAAVERLLSPRPWVLEYGVTLTDSDAARDSEDEFDAFMTATGLLRLVLDGDPLCSPKFEDPIAEGGILGTGTINLELREEDFRPGGGMRIAGHDDGPTRTASRVDRSYHCPIPEWRKVFEGSRSGWDPHVVSLTKHPNWHPEVTDLDERKDRFRTEFPQFFP